MDIGSIGGWLKPEVATVDGLRKRQNDSSEVAEVDTSKVEQNRPLKAVW